MEQFHNGHFDYVEVVQEVAQRDFIRYVASGTLLERLAMTIGKGVIKDLTTWTSCSAPLDLVVCRDSGNESLVALRSQMQSRQRPNIKPPPPHCLNRSSPFDMLALHRLLCK